MVANPLRQAGMLVRRDHTLGTVLERVARVRGDLGLVEEPDGGLRLTVAEGAQLVSEWAGGVAACTDPGDVVVVACPTGSEQLLRCLAVSRAGRTPAPVNDQMRPDEIAHVEADSQAARPLRSARDLPDAPALTEAVPAAPDDVAALFYT